MKKLTNIIIMGLLTWLGSALSSCSNGKWGTFQQGVYNGETYILQSRSSSGFFSVSNTIDWRFKLGNLPFVNINANSTDWGPVYSSDIFGTDAFEYISNKDTAYQNNPDTGQQVKRTFLYLLPNKISEDEYEKYAVFMRQEWPKIDNIINTDRRNFPRIIGIAYAQPDSLVQDFFGDFNNLKMKLRVERDGRVRLISADGTALSPDFTEDYSGLSQKVQMPGKWLLLDMDTKHRGLTMEHLRNFKNKYGASFDAFFKIIPDNK